MNRYKLVLGLFVVGASLSAGISWADDAAASAPAAAKPTAVEKPAAKMAKAESPAMTAMKAANALVDAGKLDEAIAAYEKMGVMKSKKMEAWRLNNEARAYLANDKTDQADKAVPLLEKAVDADPGNYVAYNNLGSAYERTDQLEKAKDAYQKSIDAAKAADASSAKAEGNLQALQPRLDKMAAKDGGAKAGGDDADDSKPDAGAAK